MKQLESAFNGIGIKKPELNVVALNPISTTPTFVDITNPKNVTAPVMLVNPTVAATNSSNGIQVAFTVTNGKETLPLATVQIDNQYYATTENGYFRKPDINPNSVITISYIGYNAKTFKANAIPSTIALTTSTTVLPELIINPTPTTPTTPTKPKPITTKKSNLLGWTAFGILAFLGIKKATEKPKNQRVTIKKA